jgi:Rrf2 family protein
MKRSSRLSVALHLLLHMAERPEEPATSERLAAWAETNPVVIRRTFAGLREAGIVSSAKGHGGGWRLGRPADQISLGQIQAALGERLLGHALVEDTPGCLVERAVNAALDEAMREAERLLHEKLSRLSLADLAKDVSALWAATSKPRGAHLHER